MWTSSGYIQKPLGLHRPLKRHPIALGIRNQGFLNQVPTYGTRTCALRWRPKLARRLSRRSVDAIAGSAGAGGSNEWRSRSCSGL